MSAPVTVLIDDVRSFRDGRPALVARSSVGGVRLLERLRGSRIDELWLDHDLVGDDTIRPVIDHLVRIGSGPNGFDIGRIWIHTSWAHRAHEMRLALEPVGFRVSRSVHARFWVHDASAPDASEWAPSGSNRRPAD